LGLGGLALATYVIITHKFNRKEVLRLGLYAVGSFLLLASFWYIRNLILYHDPLGQSFMLHKMGEHHAFGIARPLDVSSLPFLVHNNFFTILFQSFFFGFGMMNYFLAESSYNMLLLLLLICAALGTYILFQRHNEKKPLRNFMLALTAYASISISSLLFVIYNSLHYDFQPQGRYMFPLLVPFALLLAYAIKLDKRFQPIVFLLLAGTMFIFIEGLDLFIKVYFPL
jgi:hypothetical protein